MNSEDGRRLFCEKRKPEAYAPQAVGFSLCWLPVLLRGLHREGFFSRLGFLGLWFGQFPFYFWHEYDRAHFFFTGHHSPCNINCHLQVGF